LSRFLTLNASIRPAEQKFGQDKHYSKLILLATKKKIVTLTTGRKREVRVTADAVSKDADKLGRIVATFGPEIGRLILRKSAKVGDENLTETFDGEDEEAILGGVDLKVLTKENLLPILSSFESFEVDVVYPGPNEPTARSMQFYTLTSEETFAADESSRLSMIYEEQRRQRPSGQNGEIEFSVPGRRTDALKIFHGEDFSLLEAKMKR
jgi:hypothetical protein